MLAPNTTKRLSDIDRALIERRILAIWETTARGDIDELKRRIAPDCVYVSTAWVGRPAVVRREGREACAEAARFLGALFKIHSSKVTDMVIDGEQAAVCRRITTTHRGTGRTETLDMCYFFRFRHGLLAEIAEQTDTIAIARLCGP